MPFKNFGLSDPLVRGILASGYTAPTEIQSQAIPAVLQGTDIIGCAQTGTGKTAAFVLPILDRLGHKHFSGKKAVRSLILAPTRELAVQIEKAINGYGRFLNLRVLAIYGGISISPQLAQLHRGVDIVVATPGRLMDHMKRGSIDLRHIQVLVLDEADRMLDMGFIHDVRKIVNALPTQRQTLMFSATISKEIQRLASDILKSPKMIQIGIERNPIETITQHVYPVEREQKMDMLVHMLKNNGLFCVLVFSRTKHGADKISRKLKHAGIVSVAIHSGRTQSQRQNAMNGFRSGKYQVMVATDIAARGIDIDGISHVINYDVPVFAEDYIHRIGRTGRAQAKGDAITFVARDEQQHLRNIEKFIGRRFTTEMCTGFNYKKQETQKSLQVDIPQQTSNKIKKKWPQSRRPHRSAAKR